MKTDSLPVDKVLLDIADYVAADAPRSAAAHDAARLNLLDSLACALESLEHPACTNLLGPVVPGTTLPPGSGARVPGTAFVLDPVKAAFDIATLVRWLDLSDTWITVQTTHPSDDVGAILAVADYVSRLRAAASQSPLTIAALLDAMVRAHEVQGALGAKASFAGHGIDNVFLTKIACAAVTAKLLGGTRDQIVAAISLAFFEPSLSVHRFGSNTGPRKGWAGADATSQAVRYAMMAVKGEPGYPQVLSHPDWGFSKAFFGGKPVQLGPLGEAVIQGVLYKFHPVVIHVQSAIECALQLHAVVASRIDDIAEIRIRSHHQVLLKVSKTGPLRNAAARDHCLQYAVAVALMKGSLHAHDYEDDAAADPRIDRLRALMTVTEDAGYSAMYLDPSRGANPNSIEVMFKDGSTSGVIEVLYPPGHPARRKEGIPLLAAKFEHAVKARFDAAQTQRIIERCNDPVALAGMPVYEFTDMFSG
jgi:2-methylcitrate dehydratase